MLKYNKVLITGATGFLGSHLSRRLSRLGCEVIGIAPNIQSQEFDNSEAALQNKIVFRTADVTNAYEIESLFKEYHFDLVFHLAGISNRRQCKENFDHAFNVNVVGTKNVLLYSADCDCVIFMSSSAVYGDSAGLNVDEGYPTIGIDPYANAKIIGEKLCSNFTENYGRKIIIARSFYTFGTGPRTGGTYVVPALITQGLQEKKMQVWNRDYIIDLTYVENTIDALIALANSGNLETYNIGSGRGIKVGELANILKDAIDKNIQIIDKKNSGYRTLDGAGIVANNQKLKNLGWEERISLEEGLCKTIEWHKTKYGNK